MTDYVFTPARIKLLEKMCFLLRMEIAETRMEFFKHLVIVYKTFHLINESWSLCCKECEEFMNFIKKNVFHRILKAIRLITRIAFKKISFK